jgi:CBS domain-containing protein
MKIKDIMLPGLKTIPLEATMVEAERMMKESGFRHLAVTNGSKVVGMLSNRDIQRATSVVTAASKHTEPHHIYKHLKVNDYMSSPIIKMNASDPLQELVREMIERKISSVVIEDEHKNDVGIITTEDLLILLKDILDDEKSFLKRLKKFV